jgi:hypothetical protein
MYTIIPMQPTGKSGIIAGVEALVCPPSGGSRATRDFEQATGVFLHNLSDSPYRKGDPGATISLPRNAAPRLKPVRAAAQHGPKTLIQA